MVSQGGENYGDRLSLSDDYGQLLDTQKHAICSSLRGDYCPQVTNHGAKTHNLFNYFPNHAQESVVAHANAKYNKDSSPYLMKQAMDDRTIAYLSRQNPHSLGTKPIKSKMISNAPINPNHPINDIAQTIFNSFGSENEANPDSLQHVGTKKIKYKNKKKDNEEETVETMNDNEEDTEVEVQLYSNVDDTELANVLGLEDDEELSETVDRIVARLISSYLGMIVYIFLNMFRHLQDIMIYIQIMIAMKWMYHKYLRLKWAAMYLWNIWMRHRCRK